MYIGDEKIKITQEESSYRCYLRESGTTSEGSSKSRTHSFKEAVRARDNACIISGAQVPQDYDGDLWYGGFEAAHVFPLAFRDDWEAHKLGQVWVKARETEKNATINSVENGLLLTSGVHSLFDTYAVSINPEVRIHTLRWIITTDQILGLPGHVLSTSCSAVGG